jgi:hypothetical protein
VALCSAAIEKLSSVRTHPPTIAAAVAATCSAVLFLELLLFAPSSFWRLVGAKCRLFSARVHADDEDRPGTGGTRAGGGSDASRRRALERRFRYRMVVLAGTFVASVVLVAGVTIAGGASTSILSPRFHELIQLKTILMELLPPYLFLDDAYSSMLILAHGAPHNSSRMYALNDRILAGFSIFSARMDFWCAKDRPFKTSLCEKVRRPAARIMTTFHNSLAPLVLTPSTPPSLAATAAISNLIAPLYREHEVQVNDLATALFSALSSKTSNLFYDRTLLYVIAAVAAAAAALGGVFLVWVLAYSPEGGEMRALVDFPSSLRSEAKRHTLGRLQAAVASADGALFQPRVHVGVGFALLFLTVGVIISPMIYVPQIEGLAPVRFASLRSRL